MGFDYYKQLQSPVARTPLSFNKMVSLADAATKTVIATISVHPFTLQRKAAQLCGQILGVSQGYTAAYGFHVTWEQSPKALATP